MGVSRVECGADTQYYLIALATGSIVLPLRHQVVSHWRAAVETAAPGTFKPFVQSFYVDPGDDPDQPPTPIHLGFRDGCNFVLRFLDALRATGVNHVILNLKYGARDAGAVLEEIGKEILPQLEAGGLEAAGHPSH
jgi:hypothetical protein